MHPDHETRTTSNDSAAAATANPGTAAVAALGVDAVRAAFPALTRRHRDRPVAYFDGPGGTQVPSAVVEAMTEYLLAHNANTHWAYPTSEETDALIADARRTVAAFLNCAPTEVAFGANMTTLTFHLARSLGRGWGPGDVVVVTELDHHGNVDPWRALAAERGIAIRVIPVDPATGTLDLSRIDDMLRGASLLAIGAASNALGTRTDVAAIAARARDHGVLVFVDAVHEAPHALVDVAAIGCDFLACSAYKFHGPHIGVLFAREPLLRSLDVPKLAPAPDSAPERLETGTQNHEGIVGTAAAIRFLASHGSGATLRERLERAYAAFARHEHALLRRMWEGLDAVPGVRLYGPGPSAPRTPTVAFTVQGRPSDEVARALAERAVFVSHGDFYASTLVARLGLADDGLVRAGCAIYTTEEEVDRLVAGVAELAHA